MSASKEAWAELWDEMHTPDPMRPIRLPYETLSANRLLIEQVCSLLGCVCVQVGRQQYGLREGDSIRIGIEARQSLAAEGNHEPSDYQVALRIERLLTAQLIADRLATDLVAANMRAHADEQLAAHGVEIKARTAHAVSEHEAA